MEGKKRKQSEKSGFGIISSPTGLAFSPSAGFGLVALGLTRLAVPRTLGRGCKTEAR